MTIPRRVFGRDVGTFAFVLAFLTVVGVSAFDLSLLADMALPLMLLTVIGASWIGGFRSGAVTSAISFAIVIYFVFEPRNSLAISDPSDILGGLLIVAISLLISWMNDHFITARQESQASEQRAKEQEEIWRTMLASIGDGVVMTDRQACVTYLNPMAVELTGWQLDQAIGKPLPEVFQVMDIDSRWRVANLIDNLLTSGESNESTGQAILISKEGREIPIDDNAALVYDDQKNITGAILTFRSVAKQREAERQIKRSLDYAENIIETVRDSLVVLKPDLKVRTANRSFYETFQVDPEDVEGQYIYDLGNRHWDIPELRRLLEKVIAEDCSFEEFEVVHEFEDIGVRVMHLNARQFRDDSDSTEAVLLSISDITERRELEQKQAVLERQFVALLEQVKDYAVFMTDEFGHATSWNQGVEHVLGFDEESWLGEDIVPLIFTQEARDSGVAAWELRTAAEQGSASDDRWMLRKDGSKFWASGITTGLHDNDGRLIGYNKIMRDLTVRKENEEALRLLNAELSEADRRKNEFLAVLAHELRNPLSPIKNAIELLGISEPTPDEMELLRQTMLRQVIQMIHLIDDLLDISRISRGKVRLRKEYCSLNDVVKNAVEAVQPFFTEMKHKLTLSLPDQAPTVLGDSARLSQVVTNILNNAAKYTPTGGLVELTVQTQDNKGIISIKDNGAGISKEKLSQAFEMFEQLNMSQESGKAGLGIGLTLVKNFVEMHGGTVEIDSAGLGLGTELTVMLPLVAHVSPEVAAAEDRKPDETVPARSYQILIAEDTRAVAMVFAKLLAKMGHDVEIAEDGMMALEKMRTRVPQIVFSDISMPKMNGYELAERIRKDERLKDVHLVAMTGYGQEGDRQKALESGFNDHMIKPADYHALKLFFERLPY